VLDTARAGPDDAPPEDLRYEAGSAYPLEARSLVVLTRPRLVERLVEEGASEETPGQEEQQAAVLIPEPGPPAATSGPLRRERELAEAGEAS
jgi:hypothetical protein